MKTNVLEKIIIAVIVIISFSITIYFYKNGEISLFKNKEINYSDKLAVIEIPFFDNEFNLNLSGKFKNKVSTISRFEDNGKFSGDGEYDYVNFIEGKSSFSQISQNKKVSSSSFLLENPFDLNIFNKFKIYVYLKTPSDNIDKMAITFFDNDKEVEYQLPITELNEGWNCHYFEWKEVININTSNSTISQINKITFTLISKQEKIAAVTYDLFSAYKDNDFFQELSADKPLALAMIPERFGGAFLLNGNFNSVFGISKITSVRDFTFSAKFIPEKIGGSFGLFVRGDSDTKDGYYLVFDGVGENTWQIYKKNDGNMLLKKGKIMNYKISLGQSYWLKSKLNRNKINFEFSTDGIKYIKIGDVQDNDFSSGGIGIAVFGNTSVFVDEINYLKI